MGEQNENRRAVMEMPAAQARAEVKLIAAIASAAFQVGGFEYATGFGDNREAAIPDVNRLARTLEERLKNIIEGAGKVSSSSGRFYVTPIEDGGVEVYLSIGTLADSIAVEDCSECMGFGYVDMDGDDRCTVCDGERKVPVLVPGTPNPTESPDHTLEGPPGGPERA